MVKGTSVRGRGVAERENLRWDGWWKTASRFVRGRLEPGKDSPSHQEPFAEIDLHGNMRMPLKDIKFIAAKRLASVKQPKVINDSPNESRINWSWWSPPK
jgi:hypothetical protein